MDPYFTTLIPNRDFRLMRLRRGRWGAMLECSLEIMVLEKTSNYQALSYAWGSLNTNSSMLVNNSEMKITLNLEIALRHLRREETDILLWVDALCINQEDKSERQAQVQIMREIYSQASNVVVFLGHGRTHLMPSHPCRAQPRELEFYDDLRDIVHLDKFLSYLARNKSYKIPSDDFGIFCIICLLSQSDSQRLDILSTIEDRVLQNLFENLRMLLLTPWWSRMWTFQEIIVSQNVLIRYGGCVAPWTMFTKAADNIKSRLSGTIISLSRHNMIVLDFFRDVILDIERSRTRYETSGLTLPDAGMDLHFLLQSTYKRKSSDDRDRVYALLGLLAHDIDIPPDYNANPSDVNIRTARAIINATGGLNVLYGNLGRKNRNDLPSWVPDWSALVHNDEIKRTQEIPKLYNACKGLKFSCWISESLTQGFLLDRHSDAMSVVESDVLDFFDRFSRPALGSRWLWKVGRGREIWESIITPKKYHLTIPASYAGRIIASSDQLMGAVDVKKLGALCSRWRKNWAEPLSSESDLGNPNLDMNTLRALVFDSKHPSSQSFERLDEGDERYLWQWYEAKVLQNYQDYKDKLGFDAVLNVMSSRRRLFMTETGNIGWGPESLRPDDKVFVLPGGRVPFILRGVDHLKYRSNGQLIGDCYLQGVMDGQLIDSSALMDPQTLIIEESIVPEGEEILSQAWGEIRMYQPAEKLEEFDSSWSQVRLMVERLAKQEALKVKGLAEQQGLKSVCIVSLE